MKQIRKLLYIAMTLVLFCGILALTGCANLDDAKKLQKYSLDVDSEPSINSVVGERDVIKALSGKKNGNPYVKYTYTSDTVKDDLIAYLENLDVNGWRQTLSFDLEGISGKARLESKSMNSMDFKKILVMDIKYGCRLYGQRRWHGERQEPPL